MCTISFHAALPYEAWKKQKKKTKLPRSASFCCRRTHGWWRRQVSEAAARLFAVQEMRGKDGQKGCREWKNGAGRWSSLVSLAMVTCCRTLTAQHPHCHTVPTTLTHKQKCECSRTVGGCNRIRLLIFIWKKHFEFQSYGPLFCFCFLHRIN